MMHERFDHQDISVDIFTEDAEEDMLYIRIDGESRPFDATGHYPVLAGYNASGEPLYVTKVIEAE